MNFFRDKKTFKPQKHHSTGTKRYDLHKYAKETLGRYCAPAIPGAAP